MPLTIPNLSDRKYQELLDETLARIPVHNPEWTNFNDSDPGVTLVQLFAFLTESLLYRSNQIPERNRRKFLRLLGIPLNSASPAHGLVTITNERGRLETLTLGSNVELRSGPVPFRTETGLDVLPVEWRAVYKKKIANPSAALKNAYEALYMSYVSPGVNPDFTYYQAVHLEDGTGQGGANILAEAVDGALWIALLRRPTDPNLDDVRAAIAGRTLNIGLVPALTEEDLQRVLSTGQPPNQAAASMLRFEIPVGGRLDATGPQRTPRYRSLPALIQGDVFTEPSIAQVTLPGNANQLKLWDDVEPLEMGVGGLPPNFEDATLNDRLITWIRVRLEQPGASAASQEGSAEGDITQPGAQGRFSLLWAGLNTVRISQRTHISDELLPRGTGGPDQTVTLASRPVVPGSVTLSVNAGGVNEIWEPVDDLLAAGPEVSVPDPRWPPGVQPSPSARLPYKVFTLDPESGEIRFGDGQRGGRPPHNAVLRASYDSCQGRAGNVGARAIDSAPSLPPGFKAANPVATWGGAEAESIQEGEKQVARYLQHRDRLVTVEDFRAITQRAPGVEIGRVEVIPTYNPANDRNAPGDAPGVVTLMVIPRYDPAQPDAPRPDRLFLNTICRYLDARRLVTTEVILKGPVYQGIWVSASIRVVPGASIAEVTEQVKTALRDFLSPLPVPGALAQTSGFNPDGWPLRTPVIRMQLLAVASRVEGVLLVNDLQLSEETTTPTNQDAVEMNGLQLPRLLGITVSAGPLLGLKELRAQSLGSAEPGQPTAALPVPVIPEMCQ